MPKGDNLTSAKAAELGARSKGKPKAKPDDWLTEDGLLVIRGLARDGLTNEAIAEQIHCSKSAFSSWVCRYPQIKEALREGRRPVIEEVESAAYKAAKGFWTEDVDTEIYVDEKGQERKRVVKHKRWIKAEPAMMCYLLNNRKPEKYSNHPDKVYEQLMAQANEAYTGMPADQIAPTFLPLVYDIKTGKHTEYVLPGGRGSTKSSFISMALIDTLKRHPQMHAAVLRQVGNTMRDTVYNQLQWAIRTLGLEGEWKYTANPLEITNVLTGQKIFFRGQTAVTGSATIIPNETSSPRRIISLRHTGEGMGMRLERGEGMTT